MEGLIERLERAVTRLEQLSVTMQASSGLTNGDCVNGIDGDMLQHVEAFDMLLRGPVSEYIKHSQAIGGDVQQHIVLKIVPQPPPKDSSAAAPPPPAKDSAPATPHSPPPPPAKEQSSKALDPSVTSPTTSLSSPLPSHQPWVPPATSTPTKDSSFSFSSPLSPMGLPSHFESLIKSDIKMAPLTPNIERAMSILINSSPHKQTTPTKAPPPIPPRLSPGPKLSLATKAPPPIQPRLLPGISHS